MHSGAFAGSEAEAREPVAGLGAAKEGVNAWMRARNAKVQMEKVEDGVEDVEAKIENEGEILRAKVEEAVGVKGNLDVSRDKEGAEKERHERTEAKHERTEATHERVDEDGKEPWEGGRVGGWREEGGFGVINVGETAVIRVYGHRHGHGHSGDEN